MSWLKFDTATPEKPEVFAITIALGWEDPDLTVGKLLKVWRWFDSQTLAGNANGVTLSLLDRLIGVTGLSQAMVDVGWLIVMEGGLSLPNFDAHNGETAKKRAETAGRVAKHRSKTIAANGVLEKTDTNIRNIIPRPVRASVFARDSHTCVYCNRKEGEYAPPEMARDAILCIDHVVPVARGGADDVSNFVTACSVCNMFKSDRTPDECGLVWPINANGEKIGNTKTVTNALPREEKIREEKKEDKEKSAKAPTASPFILPDWIDKQHWDAWHMHPKRKTLKPEQKQLAVDQLAKWRDAGIDHALALQNSATNNWQGLFEPKPDASKPNYEPPYSKYMREKVEKMSPSIAAPNPNNPTKKIDPNEFLRTIEAQNVIRIN